MWKTAGNRKQVLLLQEENCEGILFEDALKDKVLEGFRRLLPMYRYLLELRDWHVSEEIEGRNMI